VVVAVSSAAVGVRLTTAVTVIVNVCGALVLMPPVALPPLSRASPVTTAVTLAPAFGVNDKVPVFASTAGCVANSALLSFDTTKNTLWPLSLAGPALIAVAHGLMVRGRASATAVRSSPFTHEGVSFIAV